MNQIIYVNNFAEFEEYIKYAIKNDQFITLSNQPYSIFYLGIIYIKSMIDQITIKYPNTKFEFICDCSNDTSMAYRAIKLNFTSIKFYGNDIIKEKLRSISKKSDCKII